MTFHSTTFISNINYWLVMAAFTLGVTFAILTLVTRQASVLTCVILGSYGFIIALDHFVGSGSLKYILVNVIRRATVQDFNWAVLDISFQVIIIE